MKVYSILLLRRNAWCLELGLVPRGATIRLLTPTLRIKILLHLFIQLFYVKIKYKNLTGIFVYLFNLIQDV